MSRADNGSADSGSGTNNGIDVGEMRGFIGQLGQVMQRVRLPDSGAAQSTSNPSAAPSAASSEAPSAASSAVPSAESTPFTSTNNSAESTPLTSTNTTPDTSAANSAATTPRAQMPTVTMGPSQEKSEDDDDGSGDEDESSGDENNDSDDSDKKARNKKTKKLGKKQLAFQKLLSWSDDQILNAKKEQLHEAARIKASSAMSKIASSGRKNKFTLLKENKSQWALYKGLLRETDTKALTKEGAAVSTTKPRQQASSQAKKTTLSSSDDEEPAANPTSSATVTSSGSSTLESRVEKLERAVKDLQNWINAAASSSATKPRRGKQASPAKPAVATASGGFFAKVAQARQHGTDKNLRDHIKNIRDACGKDLGDSSGSDDNE